MTAGQLWALVGLTNFVTVAAATLLWKYLGKRVEEKAREGTDRALALHKLELDRVLAAVTADHQRRVHVYGLYTRQQHKVYLALFRRLTEAIGRYRTLVQPLKWGIDFSRLEVEEAERYLAGRQLLSRREAKQALELYRLGRGHDAATLMDKLAERADYFEAERAENRARRIDAYYSIYYSDAVRRAAGEVLHRLQALSVAALREIDRERDRSAMEKADAAQLAMLALQRTIIVELRRGHTDAGSVDTSLDTSTAKSAQTDATVSTSLDG